MEKYELDKGDLICLIKGLGGPSDPFNTKWKLYGKLTGFPNEGWEWDFKFLEHLPEYHLWNLYQEWKQTRLKGLSNG